MPSSFLRVGVIALLVASAGCIQSFDKGSDPKPNGSTPGAVTDGKGNASMPREINEAPVPRLTIHNDKDPRNATTRGFKGDVLVLNGTNSTDEDGFIASWEWEIFELTGTADAPAPTKHSGARVANIVFGSEGVKVVKLTVTDNLGKSASASAFYFRDVSYSYGDKFHWSGPLTEKITETREHKLPVLAGAAAVAAHVVVDGADAEIALFDPAGTEHARGATAGGDNVTITMDHGAPEPGDWVVKVTITYTPSTMVCEEGVCSPVLPVSPGHDADYGIDGLVWYGEKPAEIAAPHGDHAH